MKPLTAGPAPRTQRRVSIPLDRCWRDVCTEPATTVAGLCGACAAELRGCTERALDDGETDG